MKNKWMKSKVMNNFGLKVISLVVAFIVWLVIINTTNPTITKTFTDIPVKVINENVITSLNQVYEVVDGDMVDVVVKGKRSFVEELTNDDFSATADLSKLSTVNTAGIQVKLNKATKENVELDWNNEVLRISLEEKESQQVRVQIDTEGELAESYVLGDITAQPNIIEISGGKSKIKKVDSIGAVVQLKGQNSNFSADVTPILYDSEGEVIDSSNVTFSNDTIHVEVEVVPTKTIPLYVEATGTPASGYRHVQTDYKPDSIVISVSLGNFLGCIIIRKMTAGGVRIGTVYAEQVNFGKSHMKSKFCGEGKNRCLYHTIGKNISLDFVSFAGNRVYIRGFQRSFCHFPIGLFNGKKR